MRFAQLQQLFRLSIVVAAVFVIAAGLYLGLTEPQPALAGLKTTYQAGLVSEPGKHGSGLALQPPPPPITPYIALMGTEAQIDQVAAPFINEGNLKLLRTYPFPNAFIAESPNPGQLGPAPSLKLYVVTTETTYTLAVLADISAEAALQGVASEAHNTSWLTYVPDEFLLTGQPADIAQVLQTFTNNSIVYTPTAQIQLAGNPRVIRCFKVASRKVANIVNFVNTTSTEVDADPNYFISAAGPHIHGSPGGPQLPGTQPFSATSPLTETGQGVSVAIFDTTPYTLPVSAMANTYLIDGVAVSVWQPYTLSAYLPQGPWYIPAHGTMVANRVTEFAPAAGIHLFRVLDDYGTGTLCHFLQTLEFATQNLAPSDGYVFNYSLTLDGSSNPADINALRVMLTYIGNHDVIQIAAAGNDSADVARPLPMRLPAAHRDVIGVTSVRPGLRKIVCYANRGEFGAWGGGVVTASGRCDTENLVENCTGNRDGCVSGWNPNRSTLADRGVGTSFAAPVVTGLVAQIIDQRTPPPPSLLANSPAAPSAPPTLAEIRRALRTVAKRQCTPGETENENELIDLSDCAVYLPTVIK